MMEIKALPNGAAAGHGAVPKHRRRQRGQRFRGAGSELLPEKVTWNPESSTTLQVHICGEYVSTAKAGTRTNWQSTPLAGTLKD